jgi:hypothetical protein
MGCGSSRPAVGEPLAPDTGRDVELACAANADSLPELDCDDGKSRKDLFRMPMLWKRARDTAEQSDTYEGVAGDEESGEPEATKKGDDELGRGAYALIALGFVLAVVSILGLLYLMCILGVMQVVVGNGLTYLISALLVLLVLLLIAPFVLPYLFSLRWRIPAYIKRRLWEIPPKILPMIESMMVGLLQQMEQRIIAKLMEMPKEVAGAVTGGALKGLKAANKAGRAGVSVVRRGSRGRSRKSSNSKRADSADLP